MQQPTYEVVWPKAPLGRQAKPLAPRLSTLTGKRIGFVWDYLFRGEELFPVIEAELKQRFAGLEVVTHEAFGNIHGHDEAVLVRALPSKLAQHRIDAVLVGNGC